MSTSKKKKDIADFIETPLAMRSRDSLEKLINREAKTALELTLKALLMYVSFVELLLDEDSEIPYEKAYEVIDKLQENKDVLIETVALKDSVTLNLSEAQAMMEFIKKTKKVSENILETLPELIAYRKKMKK